MERRRKGNAYVLWKQNKTQRRTDLKHGVLQIKDHIKILSWIEREAGKCSIRKSCPIKNTIAHSKQECNFLISLQSLRNSVLIFLVLIFFLQNQISSEKCG